MIAELFPDAYDVSGRPTFRPDKLHRRRFPSTFPIGRYVSQPLTVKCRSFDDLRKFLRTCRGVSDKDQFGKDDYWMPPEDFEKSRQGDCEDFAIYAWRQLIEMGYKARFVTGSIGDSPLQGHAWVTFEREGKHFLLEPQARYLRLKFPRLSALQYSPGISVEWDGKQAHFFSHKARKFIPSLNLVPGLVIEWTWYQARLALLFVYSMSKAIWRSLYRMRATISSR